MCSRQTDPLVLRYCDMSVLAVSDSKAALCPVSRWEESVSNSADENADEVTYRLGLTAGETSSAASLCLRSQRGALFVQR